MAEQKEKEKREIIKNIDFLIWGFAFKILNLNKVKSCTMMYFLRW